MQPHRNDERPPFFSTWSRLYAAVVLYLAAVISLFHWFTVSLNQ
ncbi:MAG: hypothetical protein SFV54_22380 [Bryobacteraceae bacterium]|nr:hypothetical protein [Bryobacteraceae bacterium]